MEFHCPKLDQLTTQPDAAALLSSVVAGARVPSLLLAGPSGSGKRTHALSFVKTLFCRNGPGCPGCPDCRQVENKAHPDLLWVQKGYFWDPPEEEKKERKSDEIIVPIINAVTEKMALAPLNAPWKIVVVTDAHRMNEHAQDKFLKTLEEPPRRGLILLLTDQPASLRSTILSRCRPVRFNALSQGAVEAVLRGRGLDAATSKAAARLCGGDLTRALATTDPEWRAFLEKAPVDFLSGLRGAEDSWMRVVDGYDGLDPGFWEDEELTAGQRKKRVAGEFVRAVLSAWDPLQLGPDAPSVDPALIRASLRRHLDMLSTNLSSRMVLDHLFLEAREIARTGRFEPASWMESLLRA